jgi:hypothetical protein
VDINADVRRIHWSGLSGYRACDLARLHNGGFAVCQDLGRLPAANRWCASFRIAYDPGVGLFRCEQSRYSERPQQAAPELIDLQREGRRVIDLIEVTAYFAGAVRNFSSDFIVSPRRSIFKNGFCKNVATMELKRSGSSNGIMCVALAKIWSCALGM